MRTKLSVWIMIFILLMNIVLALGVSPGSIRFEDVTRGGYAEKEILISAVTNQNLILDFDSDDWISVELQKMNISMNSPVKAKVILNVPNDVANGEYKSKVRLFANPVIGEKGEKSSSIISAVSIDVTIIIIGEEVVSCTVGGFSVSDIEKGYPMEVSTSIKNTGNVILNPSMFLNIYDRNQEELVMQKDFVSNKILPTTTVRTLLSEPHKLSIGQYWAELNVPECDYKSIKTFDVVSKGEILDKGELVRIETDNNPTPKTIVPIRALFKNKGSRTVSAKFTGEVIKDGKIVDLIETDFINVPPGDVEFFETYYQPTSGTYTIKGRVIYNNKLSFEKSAEIKVEQPLILKSESKINLYSSLIVFVILLLLILIVRKKKRIKS